MTLLRNEDRKWVRNAGFASLALVVFQGILGGMRVLFDERTLAMLHGMTGPLFFGLTVALAVFTSRTWLEGTSEGRVSGHIRVLATVTAVLVYLQIVLGAVLRHVPVESQPSAFAMAVRFHLFLAAVLLLHILLLFALVAIRAWLRPLNLLAVSLVGLAALQLALGAATWIVKFAVPAWASGWISVPTAAVQDGGWLQTHIITAHVAIGALLFGTSVALALFSRRFLSSPTTAKPLTSARLGAAV